MLLNKTEAAGKCKRAAWHHGQMGSGDQKSRVPAVNHRASQQVCPVSSSANGNDALEGGVKSSEIKRGEVFSCYKYLRD